ncbi:hypothetical protein BJ138DRAFT_1017875 [Hygrophoropsis aurantiaca]|uniref:Uncharacterized protein n=1 Tax=Hygrophoropsis aurantiaca TaxID=72124 RepID=A0ACB7ZX79_9AGAM|nr:hypothetical protein BJ138DRAFT_1017875 [Hygrophoropsis aurantiaca]
MNYCCNSLPIRIMGPTGVGKSTFINTAAGSDSAVTVGHGLESCTAAIQHAIIPHPSKEDPHRRVIFVDTPGFDDTYVDDSEILRRISVWLARSYSDRVRLAGVIYMHEISQTRMLGTSRKNLGMFTKLIGDDAAKNVILATTKWGDVEQEVGEGREKQLRANFWKEMIDQGSRTAQFHNTYESAWAIVNLIVDNDPVDALQIQTELVELEKLIPETEAGQTLRATLTKLIDDHQKTLSQLKKNKSRKGDDDLQERLKDTEKQLRALLGQIQELKVPVGQRIMGWFSDTEESARNIISIVTTRLPTDNMILILGQSGAGKSSVRKHSIQHMPNHCSILIKFINTAADRDVAKVGHGLESCTRKVESIFVQHPHDAGRRVIFVDTPGFNDSQTGDVEILRCIVDWLRSHEWLSLTGIVYLQEITQTRSGPEKDLMAPEKLGRSGAAHNTVLVTTKWDEIAPEEGERRESQRSETHWKAMIDRGLRMTRFSDTHKSAWEIVDLLLRQDAVSAEEELTFVLTKLLHLELKNSNIPPPERSQGSFIARLLALLFRK